MGANRHGNRSAKRSEAMTLAKAFPERMRDAMEPLLDDYLAEFRFDLRNRTLGETNADGSPMPNPAHRTAMDMYPRIMRAVGASEELIEAILTRLNMPDEASLIAASDLYRAMQSKSVVEVYRECRRMVDWCEGASGPLEVHELLAEKSHTNGNGVKG